ncbi:CapA family protein [Nonomuraea phyllanthi]|uniref:CapA family protein n=1 Tax=Nonomuraea phyllanthi TaxID=2219224 RepID=UPI001293A3DA|nr:CapA family protein [Nonomuraea phyllanthi]QFY13542.1 CapA family protein [Nonomuraea phyllanthi]
MTEGTAPAAAVTLALAGDTMLGRGVAERLELTADPADFFDAGVRDLFARADLVLLNLECCVSDRGRQWDPLHKPFHFRAPPQAAAMLAELGVHAVTLANNHALDYGEDALLDTLDHLSAAGIRTVGAGADLARAWEPAVLEVGGLSLSVLGVTDHPPDFAATERRPGVAYADLCTGVPDRLTSTVAGLGGDAVLVCVHWGPNMTAAPVTHVRRSARALVGAGATLVAGHSAHVFHGVAGPVLYDLGDFIDDYIVDPDLRNDLGLIFLVTLDEHGPQRLAAVPIALDHCRTRIADPAEAGWIRHRFAAACAELGTEVRSEAGTLTVDLRPSAE